MKKWALFVLLSLVTILVNGMDGSQTNKIISQQDADNAQTIPANIRRELDTALTVSDAAIDDVQYLSAEQRNRLKAIFPTSGGAASPLLTSLAAYWQLDETSGTATDLIASVVLTDNNTVTSGAGKVGTARQFTQANNERLSCADNTTISTGDIDYTIACWVYADSFTGQTGIISKCPATVVQAEYLVSHNQGTRRFQFYGFTDDATYVGIDANNLGNTSTATWYFIVAWHDSVANTVNIQVNDGTADSASFTTGNRDGTADFAIGSWSSPSDGTANHFWDGQIDEVGFWKRTLTASEKTQLYNAGSGVTHPTFAFYKYDVNKWAECLTKSILAPRALRPSMRDVIFNSNENRNNLILAN